MDVALHLVEGGIDLLVKILFDLHDAGLQGLDHSVALGICFLLVLVHLGTEVKHDVLQVVDRRIVRHIVLLEVVQDKSGYHCKMFTSQSQEGGD